MYVSVLTALYCCSVILHTARDCTGVGAETETERGRCGARDVREAVRQWGGGVERETSA